MIGVQRVKTLHRQVVEQFPENRREGFVGNFGGRQQRDVFLGEFFCGRCPVLRLGGAEPGFKRGIGRIKLGFVWSWFSFRGGNFPVNVGEAKRIRLVVTFFFRWIVVTGQPAGVGFERDGRRREKAFTVKRRGLRAAE